MSKSQIHIKFFRIYTAGKTLHLPLLIIMLVFGLMINNWSLSTSKGLLRFLPHRGVQPVTDL